MEPWRQAEILGKKMNPNLKSDLIIKKRWMHKTYETNVCATLGQT